MNKRKITDEIIGCNKQIIFLIEMKDNKRKNSNKIEDNHYEDFVIHFHIKELYSLSEILFNHCLNPICEFHKEHSV